MRGPNLARLTAAAVLAFAAAFPPLVGGQPAERGLFATLRGGTEIPEPTAPPPLAEQAVDEGRQVRNFPEQPPVIPHDVSAFAVTRAVNTCLACHARRTAPAAKAPMIGVSHFTDRDSVVLTQMSPRRYFCLQCHVPQTTADALVGNDFADGEDLAR